VYAIDIPFGGTPTRGWAKARFLERLQEASSSSSRGSDAGGWNK